MPSPKDCRVHVKMTRGDLEQLQELAAESGESASLIVRALVRQAYAVRLGMRRTPRGKR
jgi:Ribbon-helix-helix protein, copG family